MKKNFLKQVVCSLLIVTTVAMSTTAFSAIENVDNRNSGDITSVVPESAVSYAQSRLKPLSQTVKQNSDNFGIDIENVYKLKLGEPYVIYSSTDKGAQDPTYYFPVMENDEIIMVLSVIEDNGVYSAALEEGIANELNDIDYQDDEDYIFYADQDTIYVESEDSREVIGEVDTVGMCEQDITKSQIKNAETFESLSFQDKVEEITNTYAAEEAPDNSVVNEKDIVSGAQGFSSKQYNIIRLNTNKCTVPQGNYGLCWASSVATTVRYRNFSKYSKLTAKQVADKMRIGYNEGGTIYDMRNALTKYGVKGYKANKKQISFAKAQTNILNQYPFIIFATSNIGAHAVTCVGYTTYGAINQVTFYNSGTDKFATVEYRSSGTRFSYANTTFRWIYTVSKYY